MVNEIELLEDNLDRESKEHDIFRQHNLSPRVIKDIKCGIKRENQSKEEVVLPTRSQLKRSRVANKSKK